MLKMMAEKRDVLGKKLSGLREEGKLPAVLYGPKVKSTPISISMADFKKIWEKAGESTIVNLELGDKKTDVMIHEVAIDPASNELLHVDFYAALMDKLITASIPLEFSGVAPVIKTQGGLLVKVLHNVEVEALPKDLPHTLEVDLSKLVSLGDSITAGNLAIPSGVKLITKSEDVIVVAEAPKEEEVEEEKTIEDIKVEEKGKKKEGEDTATEEKK